MTARVSWRARGLGLDLAGTSLPGPADLSPITAVAGELERRMGASLTALGFSGTPRPGVRCYSAQFRRQGADGFGVIVAIESEQNAATNQRRAVASA